MGAGDVANVDEVKEIGVAADLEAGLSLVVDFDKVGNELAIAGAAGAERDGSESGAGQSARDWRRS